MAFITGYFDESYSQKYPHIYTVAGYISTDEKWIEFNKEWQAVLDRERLPPFSMKDFVNGRNKNYKDWARKKKDSLLAELLSILDKTYLRGFSTSIILDDYKSLTDDDRYKFGKPHALAFNKCMLDIKWWLKKVNVLEPIHYVFEQGANDNRTLNRLYREVLSRKERKSFGIESFTFAPKKTTALQVADILAYKTRIDVCFQYDKTPRPIRESLSSLDDSSRNSCFILDKNHFESFTSKPEWKEQVSNERIADAKKKGMI